MGVLAKVFTVLIVFDVWVLVTWSDLVCCCWCLASSCKSGVSGLGSGWGDWRARWGSVAIRGVG